ncbi:MAG: hypothetical protein R2795_00630 [Saprospiraceae bacterium]
MKKDQIIKLNDYKKTFGGINELQKKLHLSLLNDDIFSINTMNSLLFNSLKYIESINTDLENNEESCLKAIKKVLDYFGILNISPTSIKTHTKNSFIEKKIDNKRDPVDTYKKWILGFDSLPLFHLTDLRGKVETDLKEINNLVIEYEKEKTISRYINGQSVEKNHKARTIIEFYNRTLRERHKIITYYLDGVYERAIDKSKHKPNVFAVVGFLGGLKDFPYNFGNAFFVNNFDYKNIDRVSHRVDYLSIAEIPSYQKLYNDSKREFYKKLFEKYSSDDYFKSIDYNLSLLPIKNERKQIFTELERLFRSEKWLAFYALALPQVEGLFAEMVEVLEPDSGILKKALPDKVNRVKKHYVLSDLYIDYFQYVLPEQRNHFMHTGLTEGHDLNSFDLLTDLEFILKFYAELDNPLVKLTRLLRRRNPEDFVDFRGFSIYFNLLKNIHSSQKKKLHEELEDFNNSFLYVECQIEFIAIDTERYLISSINEIYNNMETQISSYPIAQELKKSNICKSKKILENKSFWKEFEDFIILNSDTLDDLYSVMDFYNGVNELFIDQVKESDLSKAVSGWKDYKTIIYNIHKLNLLLKK